MNRITLMSIALLAFALTWSYGQSPPSRSGKGVVSLLRAGQPVELNNSQGNLYLRIYEDEALKPQMTSTIKDIAEDYIVVASPAKGDWGPSELYIPNASIHSISIVRKHPSH